METPVEISIYIGLFLDPISLSNISQTTKTNNEIYQSDYFIRLYHDTRCGHDCKRIENREKCLKRIKKYFDFIKSDFEDWVTFIYEKFTKIPSYNIKTYSLSQINFDDYSQEYRLLVAVFKYDRLDLFLQFFDIAAVDFNSSWYEFIFNYDNPRIIKYLLDNNLSKISNIFHGQNLGIPCTIAELLVREYLHLLSNSQKSRLFWNFFKYDHPHQDLWFHYCTLLTFTKNFWQEVMMEKYFYNHYHFRDKHIEHLLALISYEIITAFPFELLRCIRCIRSNELCNFYCELFSSINKEQQQKIFDWYHTDESDHFFTTTLLCELIKINANLSLNCGYWEFERYLENVATDDSPQTFTTIVKLFDNSKFLMSESCRFHLFYVCLLHDLPFEYCSVFAYLPSSQKFDQHLLYHYHLELKGNNDENLSGLLPQLYNETNIRLFPQLLCFCGVPLKPFTSSPVCPPRPLLKSISVIMNILMNISNSARRFEVLKQFLAEYKHDKLPSFSVPTEVSDLFFQSCSDALNYTIFKRFLTCAQQEPFDFISTCKTRQQKCFLIVYVCKNRSSNDFNIVKTPFRHLMRQPLHKINLVLESLSFLK